MGQHRGIKPGRSARRYRPGAGQDDRAKTTGRESDRPQIIEQRIKDYHREMDAISLYFPNAKIVDLDGTLPEANVWKAIQTALDEAGLKSAAK